MQESGQRPFRLNPQDKTAWNQFDRMMGGLNRRSGRQREYKDVLSLRDNRTTIPSLSSR